ncbi:MAG: 6-bladed beta-propeller [Acidobacteriota bacterium]
MQLDDLAPVVSTPPDQPSASTSSSPRIGRGFVSGLLVSVASTLSSGLWADTTPPTHPTAFESPSHQIEQWSNDPTIELVWSGAVDAGSGLAGYSLAVDTVDPDQPPTFLRSWGNDRDPDSPWGVAVDAAGNVYIAETGRHQIQKRDPSGKVLARWGSFGSLDGLFKWPQGIAVDATGNVFVTDLNQRVQVFDAGGIFLRSWGEFGSGNGQFIEPGGLAIDAAGEIYVADTGNHRIQVFDSLGNFLRSWGIEGSQDGELDRPADVAVAPSGNVYVADTGNQRIQKFDRHGAYLLQWGSWGPGPGQFRWLYGLTIDPAGNVLVVESSDRIQVFSPSGGFLAEWGTPGSGPGEFDQPAAIATSSSGTIYVADLRNDRIQSFSTSGAFLDAWGTPRSTPGQLHRPAGIAADGQGHLYVVDSSNDRIQKFSEEGRFILQWGEAGAGSGQFFWAWDIAVDTDAERVYVAESGNGRIQVFDLEGMPLGHWGSSGTGPGALLHPEGVAVDASGAVYVADAGSHRIQKYDALGNHLLTWGSEGSDPGQFSFPQDLVVDRSSRIHVVDWGNSRIQTFSLSGDYLGSIGSSDSGDGELLNPGGIAAHFADQLWVNDLGTRILVYDALGTFLHEWGSTGHDEDQFLGLRGIAMGSRGEFFTVDSSLHRVQAFRLAGTPDENIDVPQGADPHHHEPPPVADAAEHFVHLRACDVAGNCSSALHLGPFWIDTTPPVDPLDFASTSHIVGVASPDPTLDLTWSPANDAGSGVDGYALVVDRQLLSCDQVADLDAGTTHVTSQPLDDDDWFVRFCTVDQVGNWSAGTTLGPFVIDATAPRVTRVDSVLSGGEESLRRVDGPVTQVLLTFDQELATGGANDPANYQLLAAGANGTIDTVACGPPGGDDESVTATVDHRVAARTTSLRLSGTDALPAGRYAVLACATLADSQGNPLDGDGDGNGGDDFVHAFDVLHTDRLRNPNFDLDLTGWELASADPSEIVHGDDDVEAAEVSGSLRIVNHSGPDATFTIEQCVEDVTDLAVRGSLRIAPAPSGAPRLALAVESFISAGCQGEPTHTVERPLRIGDTADLWAPFQAQVSIPLSAGGSQRIRFRLEARGEPTLGAWLDGLFAAATEILFTDGFESGDTSGWSRTALAHRSEVIESQHD